MTLSKSSARFAAALLFATAVFTPAAVQAQAYPSKEIRFVCAFPAGSGADVLVRYFAITVQKESGHTVIVENKAGAAGLIAAEYVARSKPDGHTVFVHGAAGVANLPVFYKKPPFDPANALEIVATINRQPFMLAVAANSPYRTLADLTAAMKKKGDKATYGVSTTLGTVMAELYKVQTGIKAVEVNYKTAGDSLNDQLSGRLDFTAVDPAYTLPQVREGRLRVLGVSTGERLQANPDLPTMREQGVEMDVLSWFVAMVPAGTPAPVKARLHEWFVKVVSTPETKAFLNKFGGDPLVETQEQARKRFLRHMEDWKEWARIARIAPQ